MIVEYRASIILFNILSNIKDKEKPFFLPANACPIVALTYLKAGVAFELIDIDVDTLCINEEIILNKLSKSGHNTYGGLHYIHTFGFQNNPSDFFSKVKLLSPNLFVIDDKCLNIPDFRSNKLPGNIDVELFSTGYSKYVDIGWGGFAYVQPDYLYKRSQLPYHANDLEKLTACLKNHIEKNTAIKFIDSNWLGDTSFFIAPDIYQQQILDKKAIISSHKEIINKLYYEELPKEIQLPMAFQHWRFNIKVQKKQELLNKIFESGSFASSHYASITYLVSQPQAFCAEESNACIINLFNDLRFDILKAQKIIYLIKDHLVR